jgi:glutathione S-transferase
MADTLTLVIGTRRYSSWSLRPFLALKAAGAAFDVVEIRLRQPETKAEILKWSPSGKVPLLVHGDTKVWDSLAICEYVAELFPEARLWPDDPKARAVARAVSAEMHAGFVALRNTCPMDLCVFQPMGQVPDDVAADMVRIQALWNDCRSRFGAGGPYLFGRFSVADAMWAPVVTRTATYALPLDPVSEDYRQAIVALPGLVEWRDAAKAEI